MTSPQLIRRMLSLGRGLVQRRTAEVVALESTGMFDRSHYLERYPDVATSGMDPLVHYVETGAREGRSPCEFFDSAYYLANNADVASSGVNPLFHFCQFGWKESRNPGPDFDVDWYIATHHLSREGEAENPLLHYLTLGRDMGLEVRSVIDPLVEEIRASGLFDEDFYFASYPDLVAGTNAADHYLKHGAQEGRDPSPLFHTRYYLKNNRDAAARGLNPLLDFMRFGWRELRNPSPDFDLWWYWSTHLDPACEHVNPLAHYYAQGRALGLTTRPPAPPAQVAGNGHVHPKGARVSRICLFAGFDPHGLIDDYVVDYLRELSRHADIYYLADCEMLPGELEKLAPITRGAWAERHGEYDFGSYARLARERVGWDVIEGYDELIFANDSCYLLRSLDGVFGKMDAKAADWWGMQATKGLHSTRGNPRNRFLHPIPITTVRHSMLTGFERDYVYDFHIGSYFVCYRKPVIADMHFRRIVNSVTGQASKRNVILKYESGITRHLLSAGHVMDTFIDDLYPFHPIYSNWYFQLLDEGFPFLKRYLLSENHYRIPGLDRWPEQVGQRFPTADIGAIQRNLERVVDPERLHDNLHVGTARVVRDDPVSPDLLESDAFLAADQASPKYANWWAFPVCAFTHTFSGNERALFEEVKDDPSIRKVVLTRDAPVAASGTNVDVVPLRSPEGQHLLMRCGNVFIKHSPTRNLVFPLAAELHNLINLWHGIPFKRIGLASLDTHHQRRAMAREHLKCRAVISSSRIDTLAMAAAFYPLSYNDIWATGLPRNDFIVRREELLPDDMRGELSGLKDRLAGRKLVLFMPTFRNAQEEGYYRFSDREIAHLAGWLTRHNAVLGLREHMADSARVYTRMLHSLDTIDLCDANFPNVEMLYRASSALITDYSSCFIDYMLTVKPAISFAYDYDSYASIERGAFYDLETVFPGKMCRSFAELEHALDTLFDPPTAVELASMEWKRTMFFDHVDDQSSARVARRVKRLSDISGLGRSEVTGI